MLADFNAPRQLGQGVAHQYILAIFQYVTRNRRCHGPKCVSAAFGAQFARPRRSASARDIEQRAGHVRGRVAYEPYRRRGDFLGRARAAERGGRPQNPCSIGLAAAGVNFGVDDAWANGVDPDRFGGQLFGETQGLSDTDLRSAPTCAMRVKSSFGRTTWPRRALRVGLTTFFLNLDHYEPAARLRGLSNTYLKEVSHDARNR